MDMSLDKAEAAMVAKELKQLLLDAVPLSCNLPRATLPNYDNIPGNLMLSSLGLKLGDRVMLDDTKVRLGESVCLKTLGNGCSVWRIMPLFCRLAPSVSAAPLSLLVGSGLVLSWMNRRARTTGVWVGSAILSAPQNKVCSLDFYIIKVIL